MADFSITEPDVVNVTVDEEIVNVTTSEDVVEITINDDSTASMYAYIQSNDAVVALKEDLANKSTSTSLGTSDTLYPTQNAVKTYVDSQISGENHWDRSGTTLSPYNSGDSVNIGTGIYTGSSLKANGSGGVLIESNNGTDVGLFGSSGGSNATFYGGVNISGQLSAQASTVSTSKTTGALIVTGGIGSQDTVSAVKFLADYGTVTAPSYSFISNTATGMWADNPNQVTIAANGSEAARFLVGSTVIGTSGKIANPGNTAHISYNSVGDIALTSASGQNIYLASGNYIAVSGTTGQIQVTSSTGTNPAYQRFINTGGQAQVGSEGSTTGGLATGSTTYAAIFGHTGAAPTQFMTDSTVRMTILNTSGYVGLGTAAPTHTLTLPSTNTGIALYNTSDQTTNYERAREYWSGNTFYIGTEKGGTGSSRPIYIDSLSDIRIRVQGSGTMYLANDGSGFVQVGTGSTLTSTTEGFKIAHTSTNSGSVAVIANIAPTISQTSTGGYTALRINPTESTTGSGTKLLTQMSVSSVEKFSVANTGITTITNTVDQADNQVLILQGDRATPTANDNIYQSWFLSNGSGTQKEVGRMTVKETVVTAGAEVGYMSWSIQDTGTLTEKLRFVGSILGPVSNDQLALGTAGTSWSDLFLASGAVIGFANSDVTITHSSGTLNASGKLGMGIAPTAVLHLKAGTAAANTAPLKFTSGTSLTTPEAGTIEFDGSNFFMTV